MPGGDTIADAHLTAAEQAALAALAKAGDREAADRLARFCLLWATAKAAVYARRAGRPGIADDLASAAMGKFQPTVKSYDGRGVFIAYFVCNANRAMAEVGRQGAARERVAGSGPGADRNFGSSSHDPARPDDTGHAAADIAARVVRSLPPAEQMLFRALTPGARGPGKVPLSAAKIAAAHGVTEDELRIVYATIRKRVAGRVERLAGGGNLPGRPRHPRTHAVGLFGLKNRAGGLKWKEIQRLVHLQFGRRYHLRTLRRYARYARGRENGGHT